MNYKKLLGTFMAIAMLSFPLQMAVAPNAFAGEDGNADLSAYVGQTAQSVVQGGTNLDSSWIHLCNWGNETVTSVTLDIQFTNLSISSYGIDDDQNHLATDKGSITPQGVWTGIIAVDECVVLHLYGSVTGLVGEQASMNASITSSQLQSGDANVDPVSDNDFGSFDIPIIASADLALETRIIEPTLSSGSNVSYEVYLNNVASGPLSDNMVGVFFIMPEGATFSDVQNPDVSSPLSLLGCQSMGMVAELAPSLIAYNGELIQCAFNSTGLPGNSSTRIIFNMNAGIAFTSGETKVYGVALALAGGETESMQFVSAIESGQDGFALGLNNIFELTYDDGDLSPIINRCTGVNENVSIDDACFTVTFNKQIWQDSFEQSDLVLDGGGTIYSFVQDSPTQWTVRINGMTLGGTLRLLLNEESVEDYSNVKNGVQVLGENLIRYGAEDEIVDNSSNANNGNDSGNSASTNPVEGKVQSKSASGVLASTGAKDTTDQLSISFAFVLGGLCLSGVNLFFRRRNA